jgi:hypothetical protein
MLSCVRCCRRCVEGMRGVTQRLFQSPIGSDESSTSNLSVRDGVGFSCSLLAEFNASQSVKSQ